MDRMLGTVGLLARLPPSVAACGVAARGVRECEWRGWGRWSLGWW